MVTEALFFFAILSKRTLQKKGKGMDAKIVGKQIWKYRNWRGMTREAFGEAVGLTAGTIRQYENGYKTPSLASVVKMANVLQIGLDELLYGQLNVTRPVVLQGIAKKLEPLTLEQISSMTKIIDILLANKRWL